MAIIDFGKYTGQRTSRAPGVSEMQFAAGCHQILDDVAAERRARVVRRRRPRVARHEYLIRRVPNWRLCRWALTRANRYLRASGSAWKLVRRARDPRPGCRYGPYSRLPWADARAFAVYLRKRKGD